MHVNFLCPTLCISLQAVIQKMKEHLVHVEYPMPVAMWAETERMSELHKFPCLIINLLRQTRCLVGFHAIDIVMLNYKAFDCFVLRFNALVAKGIWEQTQCLQADKTVPDADLLLASRKDPREQLMLNRIKFPIWSSKSGPLPGPGVGLQMVQILGPLHKERVWHIKLYCRTLEREITPWAKTSSLLQKTDHLNNCITVANFTHRAPPWMGKDGPRHDYESDWGWV